MVAYPTFFHNLVNFGQQMAELSARFLTPPSRSLLACLHRSHRTPVNRTLTQCANVARFENAHPAFVAPYP